VSMYVCMYVRYDDTIIHLQILPSTLIVSHKLNILLAVLA